MDNFDYFLPMKVPIKIFKMFGFWYDKEASKFYKAYGVFMHLFFIEIFLIGQLGRFFLTDSLVERATITSVLFTYVGLVVKTTNVMLITEEMESITEDLKSFISFLEVRGSSLKFLRNRVNRFSKLFWVYWTMCHIVVFSGTLIPMVSYFRNPIPPYVVAFPVWSPFDHEQNLLGFVCVAFYQSLSTFALCGMVVIEDLVPAFFFNVNAGLLEELNDRIANIGKSVGKSGKDKTKQLKSTKFRDLLECIEMHHRVKILISRVGNIFSTMILAQGIMSVIIICTTAFTLTKISILEESSLFIFMFTYMVPMILEIFLPCYYGNEILLASQKLSTSLFHSDWIQEDKKFKTAMKMILENTKNPIKIAAAQGVFPVNLVTFLRIMNSAFSVYAVLQSIK